MKGKFITFEGSEGSGKSTQAKLLCRYLKEQHKKVLHIREPGGVILSEMIRKMLLDVKNKTMTKECEMLLYMAARAQLVEEIIAPALRKGIIVVCDRFLDSTVAYQGYGCGMDIALIKSVGRFVTRGINPDLTFLLDVGAKKGLQRAGKFKDRIESRSLGYHNRVRQGYLAIARREPNRVKLIETKGTKSDTQEEIRRFVSRLLNP
ncbi:MAG TPA: dTMP kinase [Candidatus Omnitrophota bacterium]|nr:dTMP kinase [Candidatus Omnitrophota bacterium]HPD84782.1 dTMP kinase [Candidatus Omnitrophota bacterium]HRZ03640.1 dTMP kinase [Candidatus Omnitrophota bacterium]